MVITLIGIHFAFDKADHYWDLIELSLLVFNFSTYFIVTSCAPTLGPINIIGGFLHTWHVFALFKFD